MYERVPLFWCVVAVGGMASQWEPVELLWFVDIPSVVNLFKYNFDIVRAIVVAV